MAVGRGGAAGSSRQGRWARAADGPRELRPRAVVREAKRHRGRHGGIPKGRGAGHRTVLPSGRNACSTGSSKPGQHSRSQSANPFHQLGRCFSKSGMTWLAIPEWGRREPLSIARVDSASALRGPKTGLPNDAGPPASRRPGCHPRSRRWLGVCIRRLCRASETPPPSLRMPRDALPRLGGRRRHAPSGRRWATPCGQH